MFHSFARGWRLGRAHLSLSSPLHYRTVPELIYGVNATILFGTDTFLAGYARAAHSYDFRSLRYVLAGAEPVKEATRKIFMEKFGVRLFELSQDRQSGGHRAATGRLARYRRYRTIDAEGF